MSEADTWINNRRTAMPDWVAAEVAEAPQPNGSFLIHTPRGNARVHVGYVVLKRAGKLWTCHAGEASAFLAALDEEDAPAPPKDVAGRGPVDHADMAPRDDDTDDITRRLQASSAPRFASKEITLKPQSSAEKAGDSITKEISRSDAAKGRKWPKPLGRRPAMENREPEELQIDDTYQRSIDTGPSQALIKKIAAGWDWRMCMPLVVSLRSDGSLYTIDGQHRLAAAKLRGDIDQLPCWIMPFATVAEEAAMFSALNRSRRPMNRLDDFHAAQAGGDTEALAIARLIEEAGFRVSRKTGSAAWAPGEVAFTSAIANVRRKHGDAVVADVLGAMAMAFAGQRLAAGSSIFTALCRILIMPPPELDRDRLFSVLGQHDMQWWASFLKKAKGGDVRAELIRGVLLLAYEDFQPAEAA